MLNTLASKLERDTRYLSAISECCMFAASGLAAFLLRFDFIIPARQTTNLKIALTVWILTKSSIYFALGWNRYSWRFVSVKDLAGIAICNIGSSMFCLPVILSLTNGSFPRSIFILEVSLSVLASGALRTAARLILESQGRRRNQSEKRVCIYGAGQAGVSLLRELQTNRSLGCKVVGFVDDNPGKHNIRIQGLPVFGSGKDLPFVVKRHAVSEIFVAIPSASGLEMVRILEHCGAASVPCKTIPSLGEIVGGNGTRAQLRDVKIEDLLGRKPVKLEIQGIRAKFEGQVILITGAGGSIGSELCRQVARFSARAIILFEQGETALFEIENELRISFPNVEIYPEIGSIKDRARLVDVIRQHQPSCLFHAAAYKHVPMMERHILEAVENNIFGTWNAATAALECGVPNFVMISSDKAVNPTSVMGATKRVAEQITLVAAQIWGHDITGGLPRWQADCVTRFVSVRFGNVLGSNGSVIPIFKRQITAGGPLTLTHPEMRRFFMTIPEAAQLVLQAATMGTGGEIYVLEMGEPVKILDLARNLILLSGLRPDEDIKLEFTGTRPGEKLYEELNSLNENTLPTYHEKIRIFCGPGLPPSVMAAHLTELRKCCDEKNVGRLLLAIKEIVPDYNPSAYLIQQIIETTSPRKVAAMAG